MIELTRLNNKPLVVNCDLIKFIENTPDTVLTLISGEKLVVREPCDAVIEKIIAFRRKTMVGSVGPICNATANGGAERSGDPSDGDAETELGD